MKAIVTGAAGFIGSHLSERLLADGHEVVGIDCFTDYYRRARKEQNLEAARSHRNFSFEELDLVDADLTAALEGADVVYHLAGQPGVRPSWGHQFDRYTRDNIIATQRLLEQLKGSHLKRLVFAGSSSVYGDAEAFPTRESALPRPVSPYGVTKLAAEHLAHLYTRNFGIPAVSVRYFTFMQALADGEPIEVFGDGEQTREFTYVSDAVEGTIKAAAADVVGMVFNLGGGSRVTVNKVLATLEEISHLEVRRESLPAAPGLRSTSLASDWDGSPASRCAKAWPSSGSGSRRAGVERARPPRGPATENG